MADEKQNKLRKSLRNLEEAIREYDAKGGGELPFLTVCKATEVLVEYSWREMKRLVEDQGLFAPSPREAIRQAAVVGVIDDPEKWLLILTARNDSVHDYFGIPEERYIALARELVPLCAAAFEKEGLDQA